MSFRTEYPLIIEACRRGNIKSLEEFYRRGILNEKLITDDFGATCIHYASRSGNVGVCEFLILKCGFLGNHRSKIGATAAHDAAATGNLAALQWLLRHSQCLAIDVDRRGTTLLHLSAKYGQTLVLKWLMDSEKVSVLEKTVEGALAIHYAAAKGHLECVRLLVKAAPSSVDMQMEHGASPVYLASQEGHLDVLKYLVTQAGACVWSKANDGMTPVHAAAQMGHLDCLIWLIIDQNADPNVRDNDGATPLHFAASRGHTKIIHWLLLHGGKNIADNLGNIALPETTEIEHTEKSSTHIIASSPKLSPTVGWCIGSKIPDSPQNYQSPNTKRVKVEVHHYSRPPSPTAQNILSEHIIYRSQVSTDVQAPCTVNLKQLNTNDELKVDETPQFKTVQELVNMYGQSDQSHMYEEIAPGLTRLTIHFDGSCTPSLIPNANNNINSSLVNFGSATATSNSSSITPSSASNVIQAATKSQTSPTTPVGVKTSRMINGICIDTFSNDTSNVTVNGYIPARKKATESYPPSFTDYMEALGPPRRHQWSDDVDIQLEEKSNSTQQTNTTLHNNYKPECDSHHNSQNHNSQNEKSELNSNPTGKYVSKIFISSPSSSEQPLFPDTNDRKYHVSVKENHVTTIHNTVTNISDNEVQSESLIRPSSFVTNNNNGQFNSTVVISNDNFFSQQDTSCASPDLNSNSSSPVPPPPPLPSSAAATPTGSGSTFINTPTQIITVTPEDLKSVTLKRRTDNRDNGQVNTSSSSARSLIQRRHSEEIKPAPIKTWSPIDKFSDTLPMKNKRNDALIAELKALNGDFQTLKRIQQEKKKMEIEMEQDKHHNMKKEITTEKYMEIIPDKDAQGNLIPPWKKQILAKQQAEKARQEAEERLRKEAEEIRVKTIPAWKRNLLEKKEAEARAAMEALAEKQKKEAEERAAAAAAKGVKIEIEETGQPLAPWQAEEEDGLV